MSDVLLDWWDGHEVVALRKSWSVPAFEAYRSVGSTNDRARELAAEGRGVWSTVVADEQTRGRGRRGTTWISEPGAGLWMSVLLDGGLTPTTVPLEVGLACAEAMEEMAEGIEVGIKWPNDLLLDGAKVGGVLCEAAGRRIVAGIGINVAGAPDPSVVAKADGLPPVSLQRALAKDMLRSRLAGVVLQRLRRRFKDPAPVGRGLDPETLDELQRRDVLLGEVIETEQAGVGRAAGIDASGALRLVTRDGAELRIVSGSVRSASGGVPDTGRA